MRFRPTMRVYGYALAIACLAAMTSQAHAQLRVVSYNTQKKPTSSGDSNWSVVLEAMGDQELQGVATPVSIMALQEVSSSGSTANNIATILNNIYGVSTYQVATASYGDGYNLQSFVYDSAQVDLLATQSFSMGVRPGWRGQFRPVGYTSSEAEFYLYSVHLKAYPEYESTRGYEAAALRQNGDRLGEGKNLIYAGDFNLTEGSSEEAYANMLAPGNGQAIDVENGDFSSTLVQTYSSSSPYSRIDFQFLSEELVDQEGLDLIDGTYDVFGRGYIPGTSRIVTDPIEVTSTSDHLAVMADYQLPAVMDAVLGSVPETLNLGEAFNLDVTISNLVDVVTAVAGDELDYTLSVTGDLLGDATDGTIDALAAPDVQYVTLDTSTVGEKYGTVRVISSSSGVEHRSFTLPVSFEVLSAGLPGDFNDDGTVDAADYTTWRDGLGTTYTASDYDVWKAHYGETAGSGASLSSAAVPEPSTLCGLLIGLLALVCRSGGWGQTE